MIDKEIIDSFKKVCLNYIGNSNSLHSLGTESKKLENASTDQIKNILNTDKEVIYTSSRNESNSLVILGYLDKYKYKNKEVIIFNDIDSSIKEVLEFIKEYNFKIIYIDNVDDLIINKNVVLVITNNRNINEINNLLKDTNTKLLIDITDNFDINFNFNMGDFIVFDSTSVNSIKGIAILLKNKNIVLEPIYHGGKSTTIYRSGTPFLPLIVSFSKAIKLMYKK